MKKRLVYAAFVLSVLFLSCSKNNTSSSVASVTFMANGTAYTMPFNMITLSITAGDTTYHRLIANDSYGNDISLWINSPTVTVGSYSYGGESTFNNIEYTGLSTTVTITSVHNGLADGNFVSTQIQNIPAGSSKVVISNGVFKNVLIQQ